MNGHGGDLFLICRSTTDTTFWHVSSRITAQVHCPQMYKWWHTLCSFLGEDRRTQFASTIPIFELPAASLSKNFVANDHRVGWNRFAVLIPVPCPYCSCAVLDVQQSMAEAGFPECWVIGLRLCVAETNKNMYHVIKPLWLFPISWKYNLVMEITGSAYYSSNKALLWRYLIHQHFYKKTKLFGVRIAREINQKNGLRMTYFAARPSMLPPSPIVIYVGADGSTLGVQMPLVMLNRMFDTGYCNNRIPKSDSPPAHDMIHR